MEGRSRDISKDTCWFVPLSELDDPQGARLQRAFSPLSETDQMIEESGSFTITLESFCINEKHDEGRDNNDLLIRSRVRYGADPPTETINFFGLDILPGVVQDNLEFEYIFGKENHSIKSPVWLEVSITEIDKGLRGSDTLILEGLMGMKGEFGAVFPTLVPFAGTAGSVVVTLAKLAAMQQKDSLVFKSRVDFHSIFPGGEAKLRCGAYILFNKPVEAVQYRLRGLRLEYFTPSERGNPVRDDYIVVKVVPALLALGDDQDLRQNQQLATILNHGQGADDQSNLIEQREALKAFVGDALQFRDLQSFIDLKEMKELEIPMTEQQLQTFVQLSRRLREIISAFK